MQISIVTVAYRAEATIGQAIGSVAAQDHPDVEHIVIDGASPDLTLEVVRAMMRPGMIVLSEPDRGIYDALNKGIARASGDVIGLIHADDFLAHPQVLSKVAAAFEDPDVEAVYGDLDYVARDNPNRIRRHWTAGPFMTDKLRHGWMPPHPTLYLRRQIFEAWGTYDTGYRIAADYDAVLRYFGRGQIRSAYIPEVLVKMRTGGISNCNIRRILQKSAEDYRALRHNRIGGLSALAAKNLSKIPQFVLPGRNA